MGMVYQQTQDATLKSFIDLLYSQMYSKPGTSTQFPGDGNYISDLDDGQTFMSGSAAANKWLGFFFGFDNNAAWPAIRQGGPQTKAERNTNVAFDLSSVPGAARVQVVVTAPSGVKYSAECAASPCAVKSGGEPGGRLVTVQYYSSSGAALASSATEIAQDQ
jgi:hypothetical protein